MANLKIKPNHANTTFLLNCENYKRVTLRDPMVRSYQKSEFFSYVIKSSQIYSSLEQSESNNFDEWCEHVLSINIDFEGEFNPSTDALDFSIIAHLSYSKHIRQEFMGAIEDYKEHKKEFGEASKISPESARRFLLLLPILASHKPKVYIDARNGCFNVDMQTRDNGVLSTQIADNGQIYYSYVAQNKRIYKITGTAKFKDPKDFLKFNKILQML